MQVSAPISLRRLTKTILNIRNSFAQQYTHFGTQCSISKNFKKYTKYSVLRSRGQKIFRVTYQSNAGSCAGKGAKRTFAPSPKFLDSLSSQSYFILAVNPRGDRCTCCASPPEIFNFRHKMQSVSSIFFGANHGGAPAQKWIFLSWNVTQWDNFMHKCINCCHSFIFFRAPTMVAPTPLPPPPM